MKPAATILIFAGLCAHQLAAQADSCRGAVSALNRIKEQVTPKLSADTEIGRKRLGIMLSTLETATRVCPDYPDLWSYRLSVAERLYGKAPVDKKGQTELRFDRNRIEELSYQPAFDPFSLPAAAVAPPNLSAAVRRKWALVVGINQFNDRRAPQLHFAAKDSGDFVKFLADPDGGRFQPDRIRLLNDNEATLEHIRQGLGWLRANADADDMVVVYFSSHGSPRDMDPYGVSYIVTHDTKLDSSETLYATSLQMIDLVQTLNRDIKARRVVLVLDTCFSGDAERAMEAPGPVASKGLIRIWGEDGQPPANSPASVGFSQALDNFKIGFGRAVITASRADERSWESPDLKNGYFTHFLLNALRDSHGGRSLKDVFPEVRNQVAAGVQAKFGAPQNPSFEFSERADSIILGVPDGK